MKKAIFAVVLFALAAQAMVLAQTQVTIVNNTGYPIWNVYISPATSSSWGSDRLGSSQIIENGQSVTLNFSSPVPGRYDIMLKDSDGDTYSKMNMNVNANSRIVFTFGDFDQGAQRRSVAQQPQNNSSQPSTNSGTTQQSQGAAPAQAQSAGRIVLNNTTWYYAGYSMTIPVPNGRGGYSMSGSVTMPPSTLYFGNGNYRLDNETGTFTVSGDTVTLTSTTGGRRSGTIIGNSLRIDGETFTRIQ